MFTYSDKFQQMIRQLHRGKEDWPGYDKYIAAHLGGETSRYAKYVQQLCPEIEHHCGSLAEARVLDFGCGTGATTAALAERCTEVVAFDLDSESTEINEQRIAEHGLKDRVRFHCGDVLDDLPDWIGTFDIVLMNGVIEHIPVSIDGLRERILRRLVGVLRVPGYLFISDTPNRLIPYDHHSTQLWALPWSRPGSERWYRRAVKKGRHADSPTSATGPLGLEQVGAWGATYWEVMRYLRDSNTVCVNLEPGHDRRIHYAVPGSPKRELFERAMYYPVVRGLRAPLTAFAASLTNLVLRRV